MELNGPQKPLFSLTTQAKSLLPLDTEMSPPIETNSRSVSK